MSSYVWSLIRFALLSVLSFGLTIGLTTLSVQALGWDPVYAHILTLSVVVCANIWLLIYFVFPGQSANKNSFIFAYLSSSFVLRAAEWIAFALLVNFVLLDYRWAIAIVNPVFALVKFAFLRSRACAGEPPPS